MKMKRLLLIVALATVAAPVGARAEHCNNTVIFSGYDTGETNPADETPLRRGFNLGFAGCTADPADETLNTNQVNPVAPHLVVGYVGDLAPDATGTFSFNGGAEIPLSFQKLNDRFESQTLANPVGTGTILVRIIEGGEEIERNTYTKSA